MAAAPARSSSLRTWTPCALVALAAVLAYGNSVGGVFVFDDDEAIVRNPFVRSLGTAFTAPVHSAVSGRPLVSLSLALNHAAGGLDPTGYHVVNLVLHALVGIALYGVVALACQGPRVSTSVRAVARPLALATALVWVVHPLTSEVVNYTIVRTESMMALALVTALFAGIRAMRAPAPTRWSVASVAACAGGALCKETIVVAPVLVLLYDAVFEAGAIGEAWRRRRGYYLALFSTWLVLFAATWGQPRSGAGLASAVPWHTYFVAQGPILVRYLRLVFWPHPLVADYGRAVPITLAAAAPGLALAAMVAAAVATWWRRDARLSFLGLWVLVTLAPTSSVVPIGTEVGAERRMYLPLMAIVLLVVLGAWHVVSRTTKRSAAVAAALALAVLASLGTVTSARNLDYRERVRLWRTVVDARPHGRAHYNLGVELAAAGRREDALAQYRLAVVDAPEAHYAIGVMLAERGHQRDAAAQFRQFLQRLPQDALAPTASNMLGLALAQDGDDHGAADAFRATLAMHPSDADAHAGLAAALSRLERWSEAAAAYRAFLALRPAQGQAWLDLGVALANAGDAAGALTALERAVSAQPPSALARLHYGMLLMAHGRAAEAIATLREGVSLEAGSVVLSNALAGALAATGARHEALAQYSHSLRLDPSSPDAHRGVALLGAGR